MKLKSTLRMAHKIVNNAIMWLAIVALGVNIAIASINVINIISPEESELILAGKLLDNVKTRVDSENAIIYSTKKYHVLVVSKKWYEEHTTIKNGE